MLFRMKENFATAPNSERLQNSDIGTKELEHTQNNAGIWNHWLDGQKGETVGNNFVLFLSRCPFSLMIL